MCITECMHARYTLTTNNMKKSTGIALGLVPVLGLVLLGGAQFASAHGLMGFNKQATPEEVALRHTEMFTAQATLLGISVDEVKSAWASGKTLKELAEEKGISEETLKEKMKAEREAHIKSELATLVSQGIITQAQADQRLETMKNAPQKEKRVRGGDFGAHPLF